MEVTVTSHRESCEVTLRVEASADEIGPYIQAAARRLSREHLISGFRPGRAPVEVVERSVGTERLMHAALERALPRLVAAALQERTIEAIGRPAVSIEQAARHSGIAFRARVAVLPTVTLGKLSLQAERRPVTVNDDDVEREVKQLAKMRSQYLDVARPAQARDTVIIDYRLSIDAASLGGLEGSEGTRQPVQLGEGLFIPDFEKGLLGIRAGEKREFTITFPATFSQVPLRGTSAVATVTAHTVQRRVVPEINDAFAKQLGDFKDVASLRYTLKSNLIQEHERRETERSRAALAKQLAEHAEFSPLPAVLVDKEVEQRMAELQSVLELQQTTLEEYAAERGTTVTAVRDEVRAAAFQAVKTGLALRQFAAEQQITVTAEELDIAVQEYLQRFASPAQAKRAEEPARLEERLADRLRTQKTLERLEQVALGKAA